MTKVLTILFLALAGMATAANLSLTWDTGPETNLVYHLIHRGTNSGVYDVIYVVPVPVNTITFSNLSAGKVYFAAKARNTQGIESDFSNELMVEIPRAPFLRITNTLQSASTVNGPWSNLVVTVWEVEDSGQAAQFYRAAVTARRE